MIYVDTPFHVEADHPNAPRCFRGRQSAHLMADTEEELLAYARRIGMEDSWIQRRGTAYVHFDVTGRRLAQVLRDLAVSHITPREMVEMIRNRKATGIVEEQS